MKTRFALVDCNNFYASCERVFAPRLLGKPIVILSNNDGCVIARSEEAKRLGIPMGAPAHEHKATLRKHAVEVLSSNYALYGDMSERVMQTLRPAVPAMEVYSIDEAFMVLEPWQGPEFAHWLRRRVLKWTGIPVSVGIGSTKTLAKIANRIAKKTPEAGGVFDLSSYGDVDEWLHHIPCGDIWGIGARLAKRLAAGGVHTAFDLKHASAAWVGQTLGIIGQRILLELQGHSCLELEEMPAQKKGISSSKSFGRPVERLDELEEALSTYTARACEKLRTAGLLAGQIHIFLTTNPFSTTQAQYSAGAQSALARPSNHTPDLITTALKLLRGIYRPGHQYKKTGIFLTNLISEKDLQPGLFDTPPPSNRTKAELCRIVDVLNRKLGRNAIRYASMGMRPSWATRQDRRSSRFTTRWDELPVVKA